VAGLLDELEELSPLVESSGIAFMPEFARRFYPATLRLKELLARSLGEPRLVVGHSRLFGFDRYADPGPTTQISPAPLSVDPGGYLLDWCLFLFQAAPISILGTRSLINDETATADAETPRPGDGPDSDYETMSAVFPGGASAQLSYARYHRSLWGEASRFLPPPGFQVFAERGAAWVELPDRIQWSDADGNHEERLPLEPTVGDVLNEQFHRMVRGEPSLAPTIRDALEIARLVRELRRSQDEGRAIRQSPA
jgi:predicted dehydrogenase